MSGKVASRNINLIAMTGPDASLGPYYAARAGEYDRIYAKPERQADLRAIEKWPPPRFDAAFAGFWFSHVPKHGRWAFLRGLNASLKPGARVVLLDNRHVEGSSSPIADTDEQGNTYQLRRLDDGLVTRVLKNFPSPGELLAAVAGLGENASVEHWNHYWALEYAAAGP